jgi:hypothetical protein
VRRGFDGDRHLAGPGGWHVLGLYIWGISLPRRSDCNPSPSDPTMRHTFYSSDGDSLHVNFFHRAIGFPVQDLVGFNIPFPRVESLHPIPL